MIGMYLIRIQVFQRIVLTQYLDSINSNVMDMGSGTGFYVDKMETVGCK